HVIDTQDVYFIKLPTTLDAYEISEGRPEEARIHPCFERFAPRAANKLQMSDDQAGIGTEREDSARTDLRKIVSAWIRRLIRIYLPVEESYRVIADNKLRRRMTGADDLPDSFHPHRVV